MWIYLAVKCKRWGQGIMFLAYSGYCIAGIVEWR